MKTISLAVSLICLATGLAADPAGLRYTKIQMPHHDQRAKATIWYPNGDGGDETQVSGNAVFHGVEAAIWADVAQGQHPVVLFSHGMGGTTRAQAWLASGLAQRGAIVVSVDHANSTWGDFDMAQGVHHWTRVADLSRAYDALLADPDFGDHIDQGRVMAAGFSFGGWTALSMGGVRGNHAGIVATCRAQRAEMAACDLLLSDAVGMQGINPGVWNASYRDARVTHVAAIDPGFVWGLKAEDVAGVSAQVQMIGFGAGEDRLSAADFDASGLAALMPQAQVTRIAPGFHFTAMPLCTPKAEAILIAEDDDPVCTDPEGTDRAGVHAHVIDLMANALGL